MKTTFFPLTVIVTLCSCTKTDNPGNWSEEKLAQWFQSGEWKCKWMAAPDESVDKREFAVQFFKNSERWKKAFRFLATTDLNTVNPGRHELEGDSLYVNVDEYTTKNEENSRFEAHRKYADIQYLVSGEEQIGVVPLTNTIEDTPYDSAKDIVFLTADQSRYRLATPEKFFVFFPDDAHRPCVKTDANIKVRKVVVKVLIN